MELRHIRYLIAAGEEQTFHKAAARLHVSAPAISHLIRDLEHELGVSLFERLPRGVRLTAEGKSFVADAKQLLAGLDRACEKVRRISQGQSGTLRIGFNTVSGAHPILRGSIRAFHVTHPEVNIDLTKMTSAQQFDAMKAGKIDIGCVYVSANNRSDFEYLEIQRDNILLALPISHRLAQQAKIRLTDLKTEAFVSIRNSINEDFHNILLEACLSKGFSPRIVQEIDSQSAALNLVSVGIGIALVNAAQTSAWGEGVVFKTIADLAAKYHLRLMWRRDNRSPSVAHFVEDVATVMKTAGRERTEQQLTPR